MNELDNAAATATAVPAANVIAPVAPAAPVTAPEPDYVPLEEMTREQRQQWELSGDIPTRAKPETPAAEAPEEKGLEASDNWKRFVRSPKPEGTSRRQHLLNEMARYATEQEIKARTLEQRGGQTEVPKTPSAEQPKAAPVFDGTDPGDPKPTLEQFLSADAQNPYLQLADGDPYLATTLAIQEWKQRKDGRAAEYQQASQRQRAEFAERDQAWFDRVSAFKATEPAFDEKSAALIAWLDHKDAGPVQAMKHALMDSPIGPQLTLHLASNPEEVRRIARLDPISQAREIGKLEAKFDSPAAPAAPAQPVPPKHVTTAPQPPTTLGTRPGAPADPITSAVEKGDFSAFEAAQNQKELAALGGRR